jgi:hypothetical protein
MKSAMNFLMAGCLVGTLAITSEPSDSSSVGAVEASPALAFVTGTVKDDTGTPLIGAIVALLEPKPRGKELKSVRTDTEGKFSAGIAPGVYRLRAAAEGFVSKFTRVSIDRSAIVNYAFALKRNDTLVQQRGDSDDYRWIARSHPRHAMNLREEIEEDVVNPSADDSETDSPSRRASFHGTMQFVTASSFGSPGMPAADFFGTNFAIAGSIGGNLEIAFIGQRGAGQLAPQRLQAIATMRPVANHQVTATVGYGQVALARKRFADPDSFISPAEEHGLRPRLPQMTPAGLPATAATSAADTTLDQLSVSATDQWQVFRPLLLIYGFDYSRFARGMNNRDSVLPRIAVQYMPSSKLRLNAAMTPGTDHQRKSLEGFDSENIQTAFETSPSDIAYSGSPILDRSRRIETGIERLFGDGDSSVEASAFYDLISGHGVGVLALPLEASVETQATFQKVAHRVAAMNGAARGVRVMYNRRFNDHVTASAGYSFGRGARFADAPIDSISPARMFSGGFFQVASARLDLDFTRRTGTRISTVIRFSPSAVIFAIDPFAGQMSVYDPNINIYVTQELPNFGLPVRWEALVDVRNLFDETAGVEDGVQQLIAARTRRTVRGGVAFRW